MVPACMLLYLGALLFWPFVWNLLGACSKSEYMIIVAMIIFDLTLGCEFMLVAGLCLTMLQTFSQLVKFEVVHFKFDLTNARSHVRRPWAVLFGNVVPGPGNMFRTFRTLRTFRTTFWPRFYHPRNYLRNQTENKQGAMQHVFLHRISMRVFLA